MRKLLGVIPEDVRLASASYVGKTTEPYVWRSHPNLVKAPNGRREYPKGTEFRRGAKEELV